MKSIYFLLLLASASLHASVASDVVRTNVAGIDCLVDKTSSKDLVIILGTLPAGAAYSPAGNPTIATLVAGMLDKGTARHDKFSLAKQLEDLGASIRFSTPSPLVAQFQVSCLKDDLPVVLSILAEELLNPAFSAEEFAKLKKQSTAGVRQQMDNTEAQANIAFARAAYPAGHMNRPADLAEWLKGIEAATVEDLRSFHQAHYGPTRMTLVAAGDVNAQELERIIAKEFTAAGDQNAPRASAAGSSTPSPAAGATKEVVVQIPGKTSTNIVLGQATGLRYSDPDALPLRLAAAVLGDGFTGRLMKQVRDKEGLTYGIYAGINNDTLADGDFRVTATFAPSLLGRGVDSSRKVVDDFIAKGVTADELAAKKTSLIGKQQVGLATTSGLATALLTNVQRGLPVSYLDEFPAYVDRTTLDEVNSAIRKRFHSEDLILVKAGTIQP